MKIGIVNTFDQIGGAAKASNRLCKGLVKNGEDAKMIVRTKQSDDMSILYDSGRLSRYRTAIINRIDELPLKLYPKRDNTIFSVGLVNSYSLKKHYKEFDVFNINWVAGAFQSIKSIANIPKPVVLTLHDSWAYTGGCHIPFDCEKFKSSCGSCPQLHSSKQNDLSSFLLQKKKSLWKRDDMVIVGGSNWIANNAKQSDIFKNHRIEVIHPGLDVNVYKPYNKSNVRKRFNLDIDAKIILFGAVNSTSDLNKGFHLLLPALKRLAILCSGSNLHLIVFGASLTNKPIDMAIPATYFGKIEDEESLAALYAAADVMVVPSIQESFGQTASESMACGTPVVAFNTSGLMDIVDHKINGFLANAFDSDDLADGISWVISDSSRCSGLAKSAREKAVKEFDISICVSRYLNLFTNLHQKNNY